jgi:energy-coupling factor transporter ATP-binding protein EcfA2
VCAKGIDVCLFLRFSFDWNFRTDPTAMKCLIEMIEEEDIVTVIGSPGCGKTTAIHHVALRLNKEQLYDVVPADFLYTVRQDFPIVHSLYIYRIFTTHIIKHKHLFTFWVVIISNM